MLLSESFHSQDGSDWSNHCCQLFQFSISFWHCTCCKVQLYLIHNAPIACFLKYCLFLVLLSFYLLHSICLLDSKILQNYVLLAQQSKLFRKKDTLFWNEQWREVYNWNQSPLYLPCEIWGLKFCMVYKSFIEAKFYLCRLFIIFCML